MFLVTQFVWDSKSKQSFSQVHLLKDLQVISALNLKKICKFFPFFNLSCMSTEQQNKNVKSNTSLFSYMYSITAGFHLLF